MSNPTKAILFLDGVPRKRLSIDPDYKKRDGVSPFAARENDLPITLCDGHQSGHDVDVLIHLLRMFGVDVYHGPDEEADDLIASFVHSHPEDIHVIISSDRDFYQILADNVILYRPGLDGNRFFDVERASEDMEKIAKIPVPPSNIRMFKSLVGDVSDNIPGVPRLRKKLAASVSHHQDVESLLNSGLPGFSKVESEKTISLRERVELNHKLVGMDKEIDITRYFQDSRIDFDLGLKILSDDLQISGLDVYAFHFESLGRHITGPSVPDWLADI